MGAVDRLSARSTLPFHTDPRRFHAPTYPLLVPRLEYASLQCGLNQTELAKRVGVTQAHIATLENGDKVNPTLALLTKLAKALRVSVQENPPSKPVSMMKRRAERWPAFGTCSSAL